MMTPADYDAWYCSPRGRWIGETEFHRLLADLRPDVGASVLDVGCGSGYFTRRLALAGLQAAGIDMDAAMVCFAQLHQAQDETYLSGNACALPFADRQFDYAIAVTSFCFIEDQVAALRELARVTHRRVALGLLNRHSLLYLQKGRRGGQGAYRGAHWHTPAEVQQLFRQAGMANVTVRSAIYLNDGNSFARLLEHLVPTRVLLGAFLLAVADVPPAVTEYRKSTSTSQSNRNVV